MFGSQLFDVYDNAKVDIALIEAGEDSQEHALNRIKGRSKFDLDDTTRRINQRPMVLRCRDWTFANYVHDMLLEFAGDGDDPGG